MLSLRVRLRIQTYLFVFFISGLFVVVLSVVDGSLRHRKDMLGGIHV
jgi:hypothetical protein